MSEYTEEDMWNAYKRGCQEPRDIHHPYTRPKFEAWLMELDEEKKEIMTVLEALEARLRPQYVGWADQYKAVLTSLGIDHNMPMEDLRELLEMYEDAESPIFKIEDKDA